MAGPKKLPPKPKPKVIEKRVPMKEPARFLAAKQIDFANAPTRFKKPSGRAGGNARKVK